jgi:ribosome-binding protein aMBF1 (putative translation factor)
MAKQRSQARAAMANAGGAVLTRHNVKREAWIAKAFGATLRKFRKLSGMSQTDLSEIIVCDRSLIQHYEVAHSLPTITMLYRIARAFRCEASDLLPKVRRAPRRGKAPDAF